MPTASIRTASAVRLVTLLSLEAGLANTTVTFGHPGEQNGEAFVHDVIAENPQLALDGNGLSGLIEARHTAFNGPTLYRLSDGYLAEVQLDLALSARLT